MKLPLLLLLFTALSARLSAQQAVGIGTGTPHSSALLELNSTGKGLLLPRMSSAQRLAIPSPATGLMVYETTTNSNWYYNGSAWVQMVSGGVSPWTVNGTHIYNSNSGNVGIGLSLPADKLDVEGSLRLSGGSRVLKFETSVAGPSGQFIISRYAPGIQFIRTDGTVLGKMEYVDTLSFSNFLRFYTGASPGHDLTINTAHDVGIGTADPLARLHVFGGSGEQLRLTSAGGPMLQFASFFLGSQLKKGFLDVSGDDFRIGTNTENNNGNFIVRVNGGNRVVVDPAGTVNLPGGPDAGLSGNGMLMLGSPTASNIVMDNNEIVARNNGAASTLILQHEGGSVRIGNVSVPAGYKFAINGKMICEELKVKLASSGWPDYVFDKTYRLPSLQELEQFISTNKHLPNIPSAAEMEKNGLEVGDMQKRMMEKIEELTLYILQQQKEIEALKKMMEKK